MVSTRQSEGRSLSPDLSGDGVRPANQRQGQLRRIEGEKGIEWGEGMFVLGKVG